MKRQSKNLSTNTYKNELICIDLKIISRLSVWFSKKYLSNVVINYKTQYFKMASIFKKSTVKI